MRLNGIKLVLFLVISSGSNLYEAFEKELESVGDSFVVRVPYRPAPRLMSFEEQTSTIDQLTSHLYYVALSSFFNNPDTIEETILSLSVCPLIEKDYLDSTSLRCKKYSWFTLMFPSVSSSLKRVKYNMHRGRDYTADYLGEILSPLPLPRKGVNLRLPGLLEPSVLYEDIFSEK